MKTRLRLSYAGLYVSLMLLAARTWASLSYWDPQGAWGSYMTYTAGSLDGVWDNSSWSRNATGGAGAPADQGQATPIGWTDGDAAVFAVGAGATNSGSAASTTTFTVTMNSDHTIAGIFDGALNPDSCKVTIVGTGILNLAAGLDAFDVANSSDSSVAFVTISNTIAGPGVITAEGNGQIFLNGTNTYTGGTQLGYYIAPNAASFSGIINFNSTASFGTGSIIISNLANSTAALVVEGTNAVAITNSVLVNTTNNPSLNIVGNPAGVTFSGPWNLNARTLSIGSGVSGNLVIISGVVSGTGGLTKFNPGALRLTAPNTYTGKTTIQNGSLSVTSLNSLGGGSPSSSLGAPATAATGTIGLGATTTAGVLIYTGAGETTDRVIDLAGTTGGGTIQNDGSGPLVFTTNFTASGVGAKTLTLQGTNTGNNTINGRIVNSSSGATSVTKSGTGTWTLAGTNTYTGNTTLNTGGRLNLANASTLGGGTLVIGGNGTFDNISGADLTFANGLTCSGGSPTFAGSSNMTLNGAALITGANRTITVTSNTLTLGSALGDSGQNRNLTKNGAGTLVLASGGTYGGNTTINAGKFVVAGNGSLANSSSVTIAAGAVFDVSGRSSTTYTLGSSASLTARGAGTTPGLDAATIVGASGGIVSLGSRPISLTFTPTSFTGDATHPSLYISQGTLSLNGNSFTVTNASGTPLGIGTYVLIQQASGNITSSGIYPATVTGGLTAGNAGYISVSGGTVNLIVAPAVSFSSLTPSQTITTGAVNIALSGTVSGAGPIYPAMGETVTVVIDGNSQSTTINDATGDFSINYNPSTIPASFTPYPITYFYPGSGTSMSAAINTSTTLTVNSPVSQTNVLQSITNNANGTFTLNLLGTPQAIYYVVTSSNVSQPMSSWSTLPGSTNTVSGSGLWSFIVSNAAPAFYRSVAINLGP